MEKFRTTPISSTIVRVKQLPTSAILYKCLASKYWQFRVFLEGAQRKRSTKTEDAVEAQRLAKLIYAEMLQNIHGSEQGKRKLSSKNTLHKVASSLWEKQAVMVSQGELNPQKNKNDKYVYEKHIKTFFRDYELKDINADTLEQFKMALVRKGLAKTTQKSYFAIISKLLTEAVKKQFIHTAPMLPRVRVDDDPRGYFNNGEYSSLGVFSGSLDEAIRHAASLNSRDKLPMSKEDKLERAWKLVCLDTGWTREEIRDATAVSVRTVANMRAKRLELLADREGSSLLEMTWNETKVGARELSVDNTWKEKLAIDWQKKLVRAFSKKFAENPEIAARALELYSSRLPGMLVREWSDEVKTLLDAEPAFLDEPEF